MDGIRVLYEQPHGKRMAILFTLPIVIPAVVGGYPSLKTKMDSRYKTSGMTRIFVLFTGRDPSNPTSSAHFFFSIPPSPFFIIPAVVSGDPSESRSTHTALGSMAFFGQCLKAGDDVEQLLVNAGLA